MEILIQFVMAFMALFIILLVLVQRGRGGGLAGALGGPGGSSAFGAKAGDTFTRITIVTVSIWIVVCLLASMWAANRGDAFGSDDATLAGGAATTTDTGMAAPPADATAADSRTEGDSNEGAIEAAAPTDTPVEEPAAP